VITDTHAHIYWQSFQEDLADVLARARAADVRRIVVVGTDVDTSRAAFETCAGVEGLHPTAGIHPHDAGAVTETDRREIERMCARADCVAVGETGLDYFKMFSPRESQRENFRWHLELARRLHKPVVVHCRDAHEDTVEILRSVPGVRGVMHCYTMGPAELGPYLDMGFFISFSGVVTYPRNEENREAAKLTPQERILFETDSPYLAPQGRRGRRNEPAFVLAVVEEVARVRGVDAGALGARASENAARLFGLPQP